MYVYEEREIWRLPNKFGSPARPGAVLDLGIVQEQEDKQ